MPFRFNPTTGQLDLVNAAGAVSVPELSADPVSPAPEDMWVRHSGGDGGVYKGTLGLGFPVASVGTPDTYDLSYRTTEGTTVRVPLT